MIILSLLTTSELSCLDSFYANWPITIKRDNVHISNNMSCLPQFLPTYNNLLSSGLFWVTVIDQIYPRPWLIDSGLIEIEVFWGCVWYFFTLLTLAIHLIKFRMFRIYHSIWDIIGMFGWKRDNYIIVLVTLSRFTSLFFLAALLMLA